ncbi:MAG: amidohydrolase [Zetaproteobacteria bacterium]|nr:MAG: amidohydrolase [Zetaproteobacteria bacterium]
MNQVIDAHLHVWDGSAAGKDPGPFPVGYSPQSMAPVELLFDYMEEAGVEKAVFVQPWFHHWDNSYLASCLERFPDRFRGVCVIDHRGSTAPGALRHWRARGFTGIRLRPLREGEDPQPDPWLATEETIPLWEAIAGTDTIACVMHGKTELERLHPLLTRFPAMRVVIDHLNNPVPSDGVGQPIFRAVLDLARFPNVLVKLTGFHHWCPDRYPYRSAMPFIEAAVAAFGADRCMWGSDFPHVLAGCGYSRNRYLLAREARCLGADQLAAIMGGTARRLWFA